jgi:aminoglycoside 6'-N-acetyltransferase I
MGTDPLTDSMRFALMVVQSVGLDRKQKNMHVEVVEPSSDDRDLIKNLYTFYRYDLMPFIDLGAGSCVNAFGTIDGSTSHTHAEAVDDCNVWWEKPGILFAFLVRVEGNPAGFVMVATPPHTTAGIAYRMNEFFVLNRFRRCGVGTRAAIEVVDRFAGKWEVGCTSTNAAATAFWRKVIPAYTNGEYEETEIGGDPNFSMLRGYVFDTSERTA